MNSLSTLESKIISGIFVIGISLPLIFSWLQPDQEISITEKRELSIMPEWNGLSNLPHFAAGVTEYYNDHFGLREMMLRANSRLKYALNQSPVQGMVKGKSGWHFLSNRDPLESLTEDRFSRRVHLQRLASTVKRRSDALRQRNIRYLFTIAPNKMSIYPEFAPTSFRAGNNGTSYTAMIKLLEVAQDIEFADLKSYLLGAKPTAEFDLYYKNDSHWNFYGATLAAQYLITHSLESFPEITAGKVEMDYIEGEKKRGDLVVMAELQDYITETIPYAVQPECVKRKAAIFPANPINSNEITLFRCPENKGLSRALFIGDSFATSIQPALSMAFGELFVIHQDRWSGSDIVNLAQQLDVDIVIEELVERNLSKRRAQ